jgi:ketosteroid isomerase-like protein
VHFADELMKPRELVQAWVEAFNRADVDVLTSFYSSDATNHRVAESPVVGRAAIREMLDKGFVNAKMVCIVENMFEEGNGPFSSGETLLACEEHS